MTPNDPASFWNEKFDISEYRYGTSPNAFMAATLLEEIDAGADLLCVGDGEGRNGVWCAKQGYHTTSLEPSTVGAAKIKALADKRDAEVTIINDKMPTDAVAPGSFDAVRAQGLMLH